MTFKCKMGPILLEITPSPLIQIGALLILICTPNVRVVSNTLGADLFQKSALYLKTRFQDYPKG